MAPKLFRKKKRVGLSCKSPASTSVCTSSSSTDQGSTTISSSRRIDRSTSQLIDSRRVKVLTGLVTTHDHEFPSKLNQNCGNYSPEEEPAAAGLFSPATSSRYLLSNNDSAAAFSDAAAPDQPAHVPAAPAATARNIELSRFQAPENQAVVLRVSLHCKACEGKVKKHISKMEGVTSFSVDMATKKVTVVGDVTPLGVLNSISKVKNAQFWPSLPATRF